MTWKHFLKPDWKKTVLFLIILLFSPLPGFWSNMDVSLYKQKCPNCPFPTPMSGELDGNIAKMLTSPDEFYNVKSFYYDVTGNPVYLLILLIIFYILSCIIVWTYDKIRGKKK
jgi:hypothetical protein